MNQPASSGTFLSQMVLEWEMQVRIMPISYPGLIPLFLSPNIYLLLRFIYC